MTSVQTRLKPIPKPIAELLEEAVQMGASDVLLKNQQPPIINVDGAFRRLDQYETVRDNDLYDAINQTHPMQNPNELKALLKEHGTLNYRTSVDENAFRISVGLQSGKPYLVARPIPRRIPTLDELELLPARPDNAGQMVDPLDTLRTLALRKKGIVIVTGQTGSGKSTTLAAMIDVVNTTRQTHIITIEDPVEFIHRDKLSFFNQREVGPHDDVPTFELGVEHAMRQAPGIILIGEIRNRDTMRAALQAAETGHMVFCTLHTRDAPGTIQRIYSMFPGQDRDQVAVQLASALVAVISQQLVPRVSPSAKGRGRQLVTEIMVANDPLRVAMKSNSNFETAIRDGINQNSAQGSLQMDRELVRAYKLGLISEDAARLYAVQDAKIMDTLIREAR